MPKVMDGLAQRGVVGDSRKPDVIRLAPCALYNTFEDVERAVEVLEVEDEEERHTRMREFHIASHSCMQLTYRCLVR